MVSDKQPHADLGELPGVDNMKRKKLSYTIKTVQYRTVKLHCCVQVDFLHVCLLVYHTNGSLLAMVCLNRYNSLSFPGMPVYLGVEWQSTNPHLVY